jgi:hypothetical protein
MKKILLAAFMVMLLSVSSNAQEKKKKQYFNYYSVETFNQLNATPEQHKQLKDLIEEYAPRFKEVADDTSLSAAEKREKIKPFGDERAKKYYAILNPEQYKQVMKMRNVVAAENKANGYK